MSAAAAEKLAIFQVWRNFVKPFSERKNNSPPAVRLRLIKRALKVKEVLERRLFPSKIRLPDRLERYYRRRIETRAIPGVRTHRLRYAD